MPYAKGVTAGEGSDFGPGVRCGGESLSPPRPQWLPPGNGNHDSNDPVKLSRG